MIVIWEVGSKKIKVQDIEKDIFSVVFFLYKLLNSGLMVLQTMLTGSALTKAVVATLSLSLSLSLSPSLSLSLPLCLTRPCKTAWRVSFLAQSVCQSSAGPAPAPDRSEDYVSWRGLELSVLRITQRCDLTIYVPNHRPALYTCNRC